MPEIDQAELDRLTAAAEAGTIAAAALDAATAREAAAVAAYADQLRNANPNLPADAIAGNTIEDLNAARDRAAAIAQHALDQAQASAPPAPAPPPATAAQAAAPPRSEPNPYEGLRGAERVRAGINAQKGA